MMKKFWKNPVVSSVIASIIISILSLIYVQIKSLYFNSKISTVNLRETITSPVFLGICLGVLIVVIYCLVKRRKRFHYNETSYTEDKKLLEQITTKDLPISFIKDYLKAHDLGEPFRAGSLKPLIDFEWIENNPQYEFNNPQLEQIKAELLSSIKSFKDHLLVNTTENESGLLIISDAIRRDEKRFSSYRKELHKWADDICKNYEELIRTMRVQSMT